jgi:predicted ATPase
MLLKFIKEHKSIVQFNQIELENFTIITGFNGSGKSHLLESIKNESCLIDNIPSNEIVLFDFKTFYLENEKAFNNQQLNTEKQNAWTIYNQPNNGNIKAHLKNYKTELGDINYNKILEIANGKPFLSIPKKEFTDQNLYNLYSNYKNKFYNFFNTPNIKKNQESLGLKSLALNLTKTIEDLSEDEFFDFYTPIVLKNDFLPSQIGKLFIDYWYKYQIFEYRKIKELKRYEEDNFRVSFEKIYGPRPWVLIEEILKSFNSFQYTINNPEKIVIEPDRVRNFTLTLKHNVSNISIPFDSLSSGEKILFSLVLSIYKSLGDKLFPSALLLDEVDASLHPSQIQNLLNVINEVFIKLNNVKVIIATHSPTTIALAEEKNVYIVKNGGVNRIEKQTKKEALKILSEGFITLDEGLQIFDQLTKKELTIFTEGNNIDFIKRAIELLNPNLLNRVELVENLKDRTGKTQLTTLSEFFIRMPHKNKILFIYDCDVTTNTEENETTFSYIFETNQNNNRVKKGVENLFEECQFSDDFYPIKPKPDGGTQSSLDKNKFAQYIISQSDKNIFKNFEVLITKIEDILEK